jgi:transcriptional regulator
VPTWDYAAVHVHGTLELVDEPGRVAAMLRALSAHDPGFDLDALEDGFRAGMLRGIRAFRMVGRRIEAQWKMSQNRSAADRRGVVAGLRANGEHAVADLVAATLPTT